MSEELPHGYVVYQDKAGEWRWKRIAQNGRTVADSGEGYASKYNAERAVRAVASGRWNSTVTHKVKGTPVPLNEIDQRLSELREDVQRGYDHAEGKAEQGHEEGSSVEEESKEEVTQPFPADILNVNVYEQPDQPRQLRTRARRKRG